MYIKNIMKNLPQKYKKNWKTKPMLLPSNNRAKYLFFFFSRIYLDIYDVFNFDLVHYNLFIFKEYPELINDK